VADDGLVAEAPFGLERDADMIEKFAIYNQILNERCLVRTGLPVGGAETV
tara:strand:- start:10977 stop:11126 length:150 start_codon:yes stop_codon:yes gene_type:complete